VMYRELGILGFLKSMAFMLVATVITGTVMRLVFL
jgi:hypothetical protein